MNPDLHTATAGGLSPLAQAWLIGLATWVQEDIPTITAALAAAAGTLPLGLAFAACFLGIWLGDLALYGLARGVGRRLLASAVGPWIASSERVQQSERWFAEHGAWLLVLSRLVPGTRLPTYLAAGFLRVPFSTFSMVTASAVFVWTGILFGAAHLGGRKLIEALPSHRATFWALPAFLAVAWLAWKWMGGRTGSDASITLARWRRWEFWPAWIFYLPVAIRYIQLSIRHRGWTLPTAANPGMTTGGLVGESKFATLLDLLHTSPDFTAEAWLLPAGNTASRLTRLVEIRRTHDLVLPFILKPDVGQRGVGVRLVRSEADILPYLTQHTGRIVVQRYAPGPREAGIFYYRHPNEEHGRIFAITEKVFPEIIGDGKSSLEELILSDDRARLISDLYLRRFAKRRNEVPKHGEHIRLVEAGNHAQGCIFRDGQHLLTPELAERIDSISRQLPGFFIGRYDLRYATDEELRKGLGFRIVELNGAAAEATSIYDARTSLRSAYRTLFRQWEIVFEIGAANRARGHAPDRIRDLLRLWRETNAHIRTYPLAD